MELIRAFLPELDRSRSIVITTHAHPDADALGSSLGLYHFLKTRGHDVTVITPTAYPEFLHWLPGNEQVLKFGVDDEQLVQEKIDQAEIVFCLDFSGLDRLRDLAPKIKEAKGIKVVVDHHLDPEDFDDYRLWDTSAAATAELIYDFICLLDAREEITPAIANCIYAGIMTDTGSFKHGNTTSKVHKTVADLIDLGANVSKVSRNIYDTNSLNRLRFLGYALMEKLTVRPDLNVAYFVINSEDYERFDLQKGDTEGLVNYALSVKGIIMATIIKEVDGEVKMSFRSVGDFAVNQFATDHFGGGGHKNASGGMSKDNLEDTVKKFESLIVDFKEKYLIKS